MGGNTKGLGKGKGKGPWEENPNARKKKKKKKPVTVANQTQTGKDGGTGGEGKVVDGKGEVAESGVANGG